MLRIPFEWLEFAFECFISLWSGLNLNSNASNAFRKVTICIRMRRILFERFEFGFECFESLSNFDSNASNPFRMPNAAFYKLHAAARLPH